MASFASSDDLAVRLKKSFTETEKDQAEQLLAGATTRIRAITDQWITQVVDDVWTTDAPLSRVLWLPQRPVTAVTSVKVDGVVITDWRLRGARLIRPCAWSTGCDTTPPEVEVTYTHGIPVGDERLDLAKDACIAFAAAARTNPDGLKSESIDDYSRAFAGGGGDPQWAGTEKALCRQYGRRPKTGSINTAA
jgi:hypothetical protein